MTNIQMKLIKRRDSLTKEINSLPQVIQASSDTRTSTHLSSDFHNKSFSTLLDAGLAQTPCKIK